MAAPDDPFAILRTRKYVALLILAAVLGVVISFLVYWLLKLIADIQTWVYTDLPKGLGFHGQPSWWPVLPLVVAGAIVGATIRYLPGRGGHSPADGFKPGGVAQAIELPGVLLAALAGLGLGAVVGPEGPVIAVGGGLSVLAVKLARRDMEPSALSVIAATGSFAAISTLFGNPLAGAFLLLEASGLGGPMATIVLIPGLLGAGIGSLIFLGLNSLTGYGTFSLAIPNLPSAPHLDVAQLGWAVAIGAAAALVSFGIRWLALLMRPHVERRLPLLTPIAGLLIAGLAIAFFEATGKSSSTVLFSGQTALPSLLENASSYTAGALVLLVLCKGLAYSISLSSFRGGPTFPGMFVGAAGGIALSHLPGLPMIAGAAIGIAAMTAGMLQLPITAVMITALFLGTDGIKLMPLVIVAVVVSFVMSKWLAGPPTAPQVPEPAEAAIAPRVARRRLRAGRTD
jgi:H+/Cl- antiporter ClcA